MSSLRRCQTSIIWRACSALWTALIISGTERSSFAWERPSRVEVFRISDETQSGFHIKFTWDKEPGFPKGMAAEFEVHTDDMCFLMPPGGKDNSPLIDSAVIDTDFPGEPYRDVWNYYQYSGLVCLDNLSPVLRSRN